MRSALPVSYVHRIRQGVDMNHELPNTKKELRKNICEMRDSLAPADIREKSALIQAFLFDLSEFRRAQVIMFYVSFGSEVRTHEMIETALRHGKEVAVPAVSADRRALEPFFIESLDQLAPGAYGIPEPVSGARKVESEGINLIVAPGCAFDLDGYRLGYGGGYYDRFLRTNRHATAVGLAFELQTVSAIPGLRSHDIAVDVLVTEKRAIHFPRSRPA